MKFWVLYAHDQFSLGFEYHRYARLILIKLFTCHFYIQFGVTDEA